MNYVYSCIVMKAIRFTVSEAMVRTIYEHPSCKVFYRFEENGIPLLKLDAPDAAFEYEY